MTLQTGAWPERADEIGLGRTTAERARIGVGDTVRVRISGTDGAGDTRDLRVVGLVDESASLFSDLQSTGVVTASSPLLEQASVQYLVIARPGVDPGALADTLQRRLPAETEVITSQALAAQQLEGLTGGIDVIRYLLLGFGSIAALVGSMIIKQHLRYRRRPASPPDRPAPRGRGDQAPGPSGPAGRGGAHRRGRVPARPRAGDRDRGHRDGALRLPIGGSRAASAPARPGRGRRRRGHSRFGPGPGPTGDGGQPPGRPATGGRRDHRPPLGAGAVGRGRHSRSPRWRPGHRRTGPRRQRCPAPQRGRLRVAGGSRDRPRPGLPAAAVPRGGAAAPGQPSECPAGRGQHRPQPGPRRCGVRLADAGGRADRHPAGRRGQRPEQHGRVDAPGVPGRHDRPRAVGSATRRRGRRGPRAGRRPGRCRRALGAGDRRGLDRPAGRARRGRGIGGGGRARSARRRHRPGSPVHVGDARPVRRRHRRGECGIEDRDLRAAGQRRGRRGIAGDHHTGPGPGRPERPGHGRLGCRPGRGRPGGSDQRRPRCGSRLPRAGGRRLAGAGRRRDQRARCAAADRNRADGGGGGDRADRDGQRAGPVGDRAGSGSRRCCGPWGCNAGSSVGCWLRRRCCSP